jgi:protein-disulfide isomerase
MTQEIKVVLGVIITTVVLLFGSVFLLGKTDEKKTNPQTVDENILVADAHNRIASESATVTIVEFADFQCPACGRTYPILKQILQEYKGKVAFIYRHFPLPQHKNAMLAARASEAAATQGKFWEMYDLLYKRQAQWSESSDAAILFTNYAKELDFDMQTFSDELKGAKYDTIINKDRDDGVLLGVNATPTIFINNKKLTDMPSYENIKKILDDTLENE